MTPAATNEASPTGNPDDQKITPAVGEVVREFLQAVLRGLNSVPDQPPIEAGDNLDDDQFEVNP